jgi:hypothetical protein
MYRDYRAGAEQFDFSQYKLKEIIKGSKGAGIYFIIKNVACLYSQV